MKNKKEFKPAVEGDVVRVNGKAVPVKAEEEIPRVATEKVDGIADEAAANLAKANSPLADFESMLADIEANAETAASDQTAIQRAVVMGEMLVEKKEQLEALEEQLKELKTVIARIERGDLPDLLKEIGITQFKLESGETIELKEDVQCGITEERKPCAFAWLIEHDFGGLIKTAVSLDFDRGGREDAERVRDELIENGYDDVVMSESVHAATLKSFVKEQLEKGANIPFDLFGIFQFSTVKVSMPKKKKGAI